MASKREHKQPSYAKKTASATPARDANANASKAGGADVSELAPQADGAETSVQFRCFSLCF